MRRHLRRLANGEAPRTVLAGVLLLSGSLANFLRHNNYPFFRLEVGIIVAGIVLLSIGMALFYSAQRQWGRSILEGLLAGLFVDLNSSSEVAILAAAASVSAFTFFRSATLMGPMAVMGAIVLVTTMLGVGGGGDWIAKTRADGANSLKRGVPNTAVLHIILDEHIGIGGLPQEHPDASRLAHELRSFYQDRGFTVYGRAYSEHFHTSYAIPHILNYGRGLSNRVGSEGVVVGQTAHFQYLSSRGYRLKILQSEFAEYCSDVAFAECLTYNSSNLGPILASSLKTSDRSRLITVKFLALSTVTRKILLGATLISIATDMPRPPNLVDAARSSTVAGAVAMDILAGELRSAQPGDAYFAHILLPHYPYVVSSDCSLLPWTEWDYRRSPSPLEKRQQLYFDQIRCTMHKLASVLDAFSTSPAGKDAAVIIHGDHGSRITRLDPIEPNLGKFDQSDLIAGFSTLFAVKAPGVRPAYIDEQQPVSALLRDFAESGFRSAPRPVTANVRGVALHGYDLKPPRLRTAVPPQW